MQDIIEKPSGLLLSAKTFKPLLIFSWTCSVWRQNPFPTCIATIAFRGKAAAQKGHAEIVQLLQNLKVEPNMSNLFTAMKEYAESHSDGGVKSYRVYEGHEVEGKVTLRQ